MALKTPLFGLSCAMAFNAMAGSYLPAISLEESQGNRWSIMASLGYGQYDHMYSNDGKTPLGRLAVGAELVTTSQTAFGLEMGVQNSNHMRVKLPVEAFNLLGGVVRTTVKPMLDLLLTANTTPISESLLFAQLKGGIAYRQWQMETDLISNKTELAGEVQAGFGYPLTEVTSLNLLYQGVFGGNTKFHPPLNDIGYFSSIPSQHGILFGFSVIA
jgi:hypothetical protein